MRADWGNNILLLKDSSKDIKNSLVNFPPSVTYSGLTIPTTDIYNSLEKLIFLLELASEIEIDAVLYAVHYPGTVNQFPTIIAAAQAFVASNAA